MNKYENIINRVSAIVDAISCPAAPFYEHLVADAIIKILDQWRDNSRVQVYKDRYGNLIARYQHPDAALSSSLAAAAHMDHPGYHLTSAEKKSVVATIQGGLPCDERLPGSSVLLFRGDYTNRGIVRDFIDERKRSVNIDLDNIWEGDTTHAWGVPDVERFREEGDFIHGRAMDDLAGCAQQIAALEIMVQNNIPVEFTAIFNRAEEVGFVGAVGACELGSIPAHAIVLSLEASRNLEGARPGDGVILRTGDRQAIFDAGVTKLLEKAGEKAVACGFPFQQKRMDGGTCEAALYIAYGYETGALAVPLINYHNQGKTAVEPEAIHRKDLAGGVVMLVEMASVIAETQRVPRTLFRDNQKAWFLRNLKCLLDSEGK
ncbi:M20/M25/M40 family metallo-hydrolase [bacterium]|nr:M20/M25/M40 family metallo-hydrolase [bacterium]